MPVYFIRMGQTDLFKIGRAIDPIARMKLLQTGCPYEHELFATIDCGGVGGSAALESTLHKQYACHRVRGEWFELDPREVHRAVAANYTGEPHVIAPTLSDLRAVIEKEPHLTSFGFHTSNTYRPKGVSYSDEFAERRQKLLESLHEMTLCCQWLAMCHKARKFSDWSTSYGYKHRVEAYFNTYTPNGVFIAAVIHAGFRYRRAGKSSFNARVAVVVPQSLTLSSWESRYLPGGVELKDTVVS